MLRDYFTLKKNQSRKPNNKKIYETKAQESTSYILPIPAFLKEPRHNKIILVGMNPSFNDSYITEEGGKKNTLFNDFLKSFHPLTNPFDLELHLSILGNWEKKIGENHSYKGGFLKLVRPLGIKEDSFDDTCMGIDLFPFRYTNQAEFVNTFIYDQNDEITDFARLQLQVFVQLLKRNDAEAIVFANVEASKIFIKYMDTFQKKKLFESTDGRCHYLIFDNKKTPVFFSTMLSGQAAIDDFSLKRLIWIINDVLKENAKKN